MQPIVYPGVPYPLGATWDGEGVNFTLYAENATIVELCFFDEPFGEEIARIRLTDRSHHVWHGYVPEIKPGQIYGFRVHGPYQPGSGHRFNPNKLLIDPYAKAIAGRINWNDAVFGYEIGHPEEDLSFSILDSGPYVSKSVVIDHRFDWEGDKPLKLPYNKTVIYEAHVKGFTYLHPEIPENVRGTYAGISHPVTINYLRELGITAIELMPVHHFTNDRNLIDKGLTNYWGYNTLGFFAPESRYSSSGILGQQVIEFKTMVKELHKAGIEVILDVVYNHTAEGNHMGPTLSFRGVDNVEYYRLTEHKRYYMDYTGTGNTLNVMRPNVLRLIMDSLRYWVLDMHVDGFRFDLASTLARELHEVDRLGSFFDIIHQDPVISQVKLIAEPWDIGEGGYQVGKFPVGWAEWNGKYRDSVRDYWRAKEGMISELGLRFTGSPDLYFAEYRHPFASINFITAHDGFTLNDLVSYNEKHNEANGEHNNDGEEHNRSWNCGIEGPSSDPYILELRNRLKRSFLTTLFLSQGVPMIVSGDELGRTQRGNNNAYCQDNEISWLDWRNADRQLFRFTSNLIHFYRRHPVFSRRRWFKGQPIKDIPVEDIAWFLPNGEMMKEENWTDPLSKSLAVYLNGKSLRTIGATGEMILDDDFFIVFNAHHETLEYRLPIDKYGRNWYLVIDTSRDYIDEEGLSLLDSHENKIVVGGHSVVVLKQPKFS